MVDKVRKVKLRSLRSDAKAEREGDWVSYSLIPGSRFKVKSLECPEFKDARELLLRKLSARYRGKPIPSDEMTKELGSLVANIILLDWDGMDEPWTPELGEEIMTDPFMRKVHDAVNYCANIVGEGEIEFVEGAIKN